MGTADTAQDGINANTPQTRRIELTPTQLTTDYQVAILSNVSGAPTTSDYQPSIAIVIDKALDGAGTVVDRSVSVSEPPGGYIQAIVAGPKEPLLATVADTPLDDGRGLQNSPLWRFIHLQRLADPTQPYNATTNPYLTIDSAPVGLNVFNGVANEVGIDEVVLQSNQRGNEFVDKQAALVLRAAVLQYGLYEHHVRTGWEPTPFQPKFVAFLWLFEHGTGSGWWCGRVYGNRSSASFFSGFEQNPYALADVEQPPLCRTA